MDSQAVRRRLKPRSQGVAAAAACSALLTGAAWAQDTTFDDGPVLAERLLAGVVRVHGGEHGFGVVVGADDTFIYVVTAGHVVGSSGPVLLHGCKQALPPDLPAERMAGFDPAAADVALLRAQRPPGYRLVIRAMAPEERVAISDPAWLLGRDDTCAVRPASGAVAALADTRKLWRIDMPGVLGGSSGAPVATGRGLIALTTDSDNVNLTALGLASLSMRVRAAGARFDLVDARNEPPTDPLAAELDLAEMLGGFLRELRDAQTVLRQPTVKREYFARTVAEYDEVAKRFLATKDKYAGTLARNWPPEVGPQWLALRDRLWSAHENFLAVNSHARQIVETERIPQIVRDRMEALDPELGALQGAIAQFLRALSQRRPSNDTQPP
ncbi:trypsin-like peptidase domain-containing protein [Roseateles sp. DAIF2]|uniref:S1 family peptidase n=1 Tax=Roseateles sp. DAIF2 TaxID=2714952 RepID=UPI0018A2BCE5|nr:serine protease [Roseateles sp. DAIF2]QPF74381.1 trypsin-like peptidase domain-containing protein [Roseateles sp. DAIF2]